MELNKKTSLSRAYRICLACFLVVGLLLLLVKKNLGLGWLLGTGIYWLNQSVRIFLLRDPHQSMRGIWLQFIVTLVLFASGLALGIKVPDWFNWMSLALAFCLFHYLSIFLAYRDARRVS